ncbi:Thymidylate synthase complementing protein [Leptolyngbyaceae cyanobacterium JSC-12]|nr:Thymidylate synthase complementing protein [Leptolyngbyaceae cyanobacterium JSC-12]
MMVQATYNSELGIAGLTDTQSGISVYTLLQNPGRKQPSVNAYLAARYSRSGDSIEKILSEVQTNQVDAAERLGKIFSGYGHASVAGMAHLFCCVENVPAVTAMRFFYLCPTQDGQERSSRYQNFSQGKWANRFPVSLPTKLRVKFSALIKTQLQMYTNLITPTQEQLQRTFSISSEDTKDLSALKSRAFDTVRMLLPMGILTNFGAVQSAREWSRYIGVMGGSSDPHEKIVGDLLRALLTGTRELEELGYVPEAAELIRHSQPSSVIEDSTNKLVAAAEQLVKNPQINKLKLPNLAVGYTHARMALFEHVAMLAQPGIRLDYSAVQELESFGKFLHLVHSQHTPMGPIAQHGAIQLRGFTDLGSLKDLNRHRSLERFIPFLDNCGSAEKELANGFMHCAYLQALPSVRTQLLDIYNACLTTYYKDIYAWAKEASDYLTKAELYSLVRYLLPHAHRSEYAMYGSVDDLIYTIRTRIRPGGHINYRMLVHSWLKALSDTHSWWHPLYQALEKPDPTNKAQFTDRS